MNTDEIRKYIAILLKKRKDPWWGMTIISGSYISAPYIPVHNFSIGSIFLSFPSNLPKTEITSGSIEVQDIEFVTISETGSCPIREGVQTRYAETAVSGSCFGTIKISDMKK